MSTSTVRPGLPRWLHTPTDTAAVAAALLCLLDGAMTVPHWHLEGNPVVLQLGLEGMMAVKLVATVAFVALWFYSVRGSHVERYGRYAVWALFGLYVAVVWTNLAMLTVTL